ncbi:rab3 GTPase-activating protein non-catalytic subunit-like isoform X2 [Pomacea canaliculata]|uniref:rab3 GTPase-activating protein non-catalytic subunit-like isoform X2 n=1 Tax=Pomacea canaliculata TaxID=400727 RepID=UPI000D73A9FA|nr:rab3 GTPase-activating protein non-catalytic subunit-like isoform X2 [Pomacea canaliculata]
MSCQLTVLSRFHDIVAVRRFLFPHLKDSSPLPSGASDAEGEDEWAQDWGWGSDNPGPNIQSNNASVEVVDEGVHKWLQSSILSLSPNNDIIAIANEDRICVLTQKWDPQNKGEELDTLLTTVWQGNVRQEDGESITDVMCLPLASHKRSTQGAPDWTCVIIGMSSGYVRMYTETGVLLLSQLLHIEPVQKLKCRTYEPPRFLGMAEKHEELIILYKKAVVSIDGFSLIQSLRACRNQVARATASGSESFVQPPPLAYKKWALNDQETITDLVTCGVVSSNPFDQMKNASMQGGFNTIVKTSPPAATVFLTSGMGPYVGFFYAVEGTMQPILSEVAMAMAHKIKSALMSAASGWLGFGGWQKEDAKEKPPKIEPAAPLPLRFGLPDKRRMGHSIVLSPCNTYMATTDSFGRVILVDIQHGIAVRMWKGYRDAQIGWVQIKEDGGKGDHSRVAQFLIIYAPRRGILEVWTAVHGPRVAAFNVSKHCVLVCPSHGMMGLNNVTYHTVKPQMFHCALVDPEGCIKTLDIPFHLALSDKSSKRARDLHLLKKLKSILKEANCETENLKAAVRETFLDIRIASISHQALEKILSTRYLSVSFMQEIVQAVTARLAARGEESLDIDSRMLLRFASTQAALLDMYASIVMLSSQGVAQQAEIFDAETLEEVLDLQEKEAANVATRVKEFETARISCGLRVRFTHTQLPPTSFLHCFSSRAHASDTDKTITTISISKEVSEERRQALAHLLFYGCLKGACSAQDIGLVLQQSSLAPEQLLNLLLLHWLSSDEHSLSALPCLRALVSSITAMTDMMEVLVDHNTVSPWWQRVRDACSQCENSCPAYLAALTCRKVAANLIGRQTQAKDPDADVSSDKEEEEQGVKDMNTSAESWESLAVDLELWDLLVLQLEDTLALNTMLHMNIPASEKDGDIGGMPADPIKLSVSKLLEGGRGSISELVARFVASQNLGPHALYNFRRQVSGESHVLQSHGVEEDLEDNAAEKMTSLKRFKSHLDALRLRFPHSLENDILITNCCWEYVVLWNKDPDVVKHLQMSVEYLKLVQNAVLRQGVSSMLWHMFILKRMSAIANLMEKVGKSPKDRLCRKEAGMSEQTMETFVGIVVELLDVIMDANCEANEVPVFNIETIWQGAHGPASLAELAVDAKPTNYGLVRLHWHLATLMHAILIFKMKSVKVLSLFDRKGHAALFKDLHSHPLLPNQKVEESLALARRTVLAEIITYAVSTLDPPQPSVVEPSLASSPPSRRQRAQHPLAFRWPQIVLTLARDFGLDMDFMKRQHVCELYSQGHDKLAEEVLTTVNEHDLMGSQLLVLAGRRLAYRLIYENPRATLHLFSIITPNISSWLRSLDVDQLAYKDAPVTDTAVLINRAASKLAEGSVEHDRALGLIDLVEAMS